MGRLYTGPMNPCRALASIDLENATRNEYRIQLERTDIEFGEWDR